MPLRHAIAFDAIAKPGQMPAGLCPVYVPDAPDFLGVYPFSADRLRLPGGASEMRLEVSLALFAELEYGAHGRVEAVVPRLAGPMLGATVGEAGMKWSVRRMWGAQSRAIPVQLEILDGFSPGGILDRLQVCAWVGREGVWYAAAAPVRAAQALVLFDRPVLDWLVFAMNDQADHGPFERLSTRLAQAGEPTHALVSWGGALMETPPVRAGDAVCVAAWDDARMNAIEVAQWLAEGTPETPEALCAMRVEVA